MIIDFENQWIATLIITLISTSVAFVIVVIYDMDYPFKGGFWAIEPKAYLNLENIIKNT
jgi:hypothetical protein